MSKKSSFVKEVRMKNHNQGFEKIVESIRPNIKEIDIARFKEIQSSDHHFILIDVREDEEWDLGHIPNAVHINRGVIERDIENHVPDKESAIILYCGGGYRSALAADNLQKMGYKNVLSLIGGFRAWKQNNN